jgi:polyisoprenoid-binding protein YceI
MSSRILPPLIALLGLTSPALAAPVTYEIDSSHTDIVWMADHLGFSKSIGEFARSSGTLVLDTENPAASHVDVTVDIASLQTGDAKFDKHLLSKDFLNLDEFRRATFKSSNVEITGEKTARVTGDLTLHGVTKPLTMDVTLNKMGKNPFSNKETAGFSIRTKLYRSQFGITYGLPMIGDEVELVIEAEATLPETPQAPAKKG